MAKVRVTPIFRDIAKSDHKTYFVNFCNKIKCVLESIADTCHRCIYGIEIHEIDEYSISYITFGSPKTQVSSVAKNYYIEFDLPSNVELEQVSMRIADSVGDRFKIEQVS